MNNFNAEFKESLLKKVCIRESGTSIHQIAIDANVKPSILYYWISKAKGKVTKMSKDNYTSEDKFEFCLKYFSLIEAEKGEFLRANGLYSYQLDSWRSDFINSSENLNTKKNNTVKNDKVIIKALEKELRRKEKALAETATLLTLKKKFQDLNLGEE